MDKLPDDILPRCLKLQQALEHESECDLKGAELCEELKQISCLIPSAKSDPLNVLHFLTDNNAIDLFPNLYVALRILLTIPVTPSASAERSFSKLKIIKSYLRSTMTDERFSSLSILSIEQEVTKVIDFSEVLSDFAANKARRVLF